MATGNSQPAHGTSSFGSGTDALLERNLTALGRPGTHVAERIRRADPALIEFEPARDGTLVGTPVSGTPLASRHQPLDEAQRWAGEVDITGTAFALVLGFGLGYHIRALVERMRGTGVVVVYEPDPGLLKTVLSTIDCTDWLNPARIRLLCDEDDELQTTAAWSDAHSHMVAGTRILEHPSSKARLGEHAGAVGARLSDAVNRARMMISTVLMRSLGTVQNELYNIDHYVNGTGIAELAGCATGHLGIVVSAGPSLQRTLHLLKDPAIRDRCVIISAQTTLRPLLDAGIKPHFVTALDYHQISKRFYEGLDEQDVEGITLVALPQAHPVIADTWPGRIRWCRALVLEDLLGPLAPSYTDLPAASTVAHLSYHLARYLGCDPVALIGQDLGFTDGVYYSRGTAIDDIWSTELNPFNTVALMEWQRIVRHKGMLHRLEDLDGKTILTDDQMLSYLRQFEEFFTEDQDRGLTTIDAGGGGVRKKGTVVRSLEDVLGECTDSDQGGLSRRIDDLLEQQPGSNVDPMDRIRQFREEVRRLVELCGSTVQSLDQLSLHQSNPEVSGRLFKQIERNREAVSRLDGAFGFVDRVNRLGAFKRFLADRRIDVLEIDDPLEHQALQIRRDLVNVQFIEDAGRETEALLDDALTILEEGSSGLLQGSNARSTLTSTAMDLDEEATSSTERVAALVPISPERGGAGSRRSLSHQFGDQDSLRLTIQRLSSSQSLDQIILMLPDDYELPFTIEDLQPGVPVAVVRCGESPFGPEHEAIVAARMFADRCWRGGIAGMTVFDEVLAPSLMSTLMEREGIDGAILCGPDWPLVEVLGPGGVDRLIARWRHHQGREPFIFTQAPPGLGACLVSRKLMGALSSRNRLATIGAMLGYRPDRPKHDPIVGEGNLQIDPQVRRALVRAIYDSPRTRYRLRSAVEPILSTKKTASTKLHSREIVDQLEFERRGGLPHFTPRHVIVELCTGRLSSGVCSPHRAGTIQREAMSERRFQRIVSELGDSNDAMITLGGVGDPLQHPRCIDFIEMALEKGVRGVHVRTELQCSEDRVLELARSGAQVVSVDLNADTRESYHNVMGHDGYDVVLDRIKTLVGARRCLAGQGVGALALPWVVPRIQRTVHTFEDIESFYERWQGILGTALIDPEHIGIGRRESAQEVLASVENPERTQIAECFRRMTVYSDGSVPFAEQDLDAHSIAGNVDVEGIMKLWRRVVGARRRALREHGPRSPLVRTYQS
ncbi:MAG: 6-hydroxymethylpterin diphosphokinase MptE-like protein [Planctomycetota bacterium]|nr:6-hydroxymethylpterin diphosphokinase MptE-like protein [Planctomycetota bacterium]